jgi:tetratricopeptide (TPR) repeat protein
LVPRALIDGRFEIERAAGAGGVGVVFLAYDHLERAPVALKLLRGAAAGEMERFAREARILADLSHPGIVRHVAHGECASGERYLAMEWLEGEDLGERLARAPLSVEETLAVVGAAAAALAVAHAHGLVHRDVKPSNVFLVDGRADDVRLLDFGAAGVIEGGAPITESGALLGTPGYMAPEQVLGVPARDPRADVFGLGCVLFEALTGRRAFEGKNLVALLAKVLVEDVPPLGSLRPDLPPALERLVRKMMARDPALRLRDAGEVVRAIDALGHEAPTPAPTAAIPVLRGALTTVEQRIVTVVLAAFTSEGGMSEERGSVPGPSASEMLMLAEREIHRHGGRLDVLPGGAMLVTIWGSGSAVDRAARACRSALHLRDGFPSARIVVATGRGVVSSQVVEGSVLDRAADSLGAPGVVQLDLATAEMLDARFLVDETNVLLREQDRADAAPLLLGKPSPFVGRSREIGLLEAMYRGSFEEGTASAVLVTGEAGTGKSRLFRELCVRIGRRGPVTEIVGKASWLAESSPYGVLGDAVRSAADIREGEGIEDRRKKLVARLGTVLTGAALARVSAFLGEMCGTAFPDAAAPALAAARGNAQVMGDMMRGAWEDWLAAECAVKPVVLRLEDLHWGDAATIRLVDATLRNLTDLPLVVLASARPEIHARFPSLWAARNVHALALAPLPRSASERLVRAALPGATADTVARIVERADGSPFYLEELVRAVAAGRDDVFPDSVLAIVEARLDAEGVVHKRILRAASVFGEQFSARGVATLLGGERHLGVAREALSRLAARELVTATYAREGDGGEPTFAFGHAFVRAAAYAALTEEDRALGHRLAAEWLEMRGTTEAVMLAEHFSRGGEAKRAARWYRRAAEQALLADDLAGAIERVERARACSAEGDELGALLLVEAEARVWRGELALAEACGIEANKRLPRGSAGWFKSHHSAVVAACKLGEPDRPERCSAEVRAVAGADTAAVAARYRCLTACASSLVLCGRYAAADEALAELATLSPPDALSAAMAHESRAFRASARGDSLACLEDLERALAAFEEGEDRRNATMTRGNLGFIRLELGDLEPAETTLRIALATADRMGLSDVAAVTRCNLGFVLSCRGEVEEARALIRESIHAFRRQESARNEGLALAYLAQASLASGDARAAENEASSAVDVLHAIESLRPMAMAVLARALIALGRAHDALAAAAAAYEALQALGSIEEGDALVRLAYGEALAACGRAVEAAHVFESARQRLLERASAIRDPVWQQRFLTNVPENARTLATDNLPQLGDRNNASTPV